MVYWYEVKLIPIAKKKNIGCPECEGIRMLKKGRRKNKSGGIQRYRCNRCGRSFSLNKPKGRVYPAEANENSESFL